MLAEDVITGERRSTLNSHLVFVKRGRGRRPRPVEAQIVPGTPPSRRWSRRPGPGASSGWRGSPSDSRAWPRAPSRIWTPATSTSRGAFESVRSVLPEDALFGNMMFAGKMLMELDEAGGILSMRYCKGLVMTACVDAMDFYSPILTHEVVTFKAALNHVGTSSLEVGVKVLAEKSRGPGEVRHACTAFVTYVHLGTDLRPRPCPPFTPTTEGERRRWEAALARRAQRLERVKRLKAMLLDERG